MTGETADHTQAGHPERRRVRYLTYREFVIWATCMIVAWLLILAASVGAAYIAWSTDNELDRSGADAIYRSCASRAELRVTTAAAIDSLRRLAVRPDDPDQSRAERQDAIDGFLRRTQEPIDRLLTAAAGERTRAMLRRPISQADQDAIMAKARVRCLGEATDFLAAGRAPAP